MINPHKIQVNMELSNLEAFNKLVAARPALERQIALARIDTGLKLQEYFKSKLPYEKHLLQITEAGGVILMLDSTYNIRRTAVLLNFSIEDCGTCTRAYATASIFRECSETFRGQVEETVASFNRYVEDNGQDFLWGITQIIRAGRSAVSAAYAAKNENECEINRLSDAAKTELTAFILKKLLPGVKFQPAISINIRGREFEKVEKVRLVRANRDNCTVLIVNSGEHSEIKMSIGEIRKIFEKIF